MLFGFAPMLRVPKQPYVWRVRTRCTQRGKFTIGPLMLRGGDPFGLFPAERVIPQVTDLLVYPATVDVSAFAVSVGELPGGAATQRRTHYVTPNASGVREYMFGDSFNRIAWSTTARTGRMMVKEFELDPTTDIWVLLDLYHGSHVVAPPPQPGVPEPLDEWAVSTEETAVTVAASVMQHFLEQGRNVGLVARGAHTEILTTHQCAFPCTPFGASWLASSDATQLPYCSTTGTVNCNPQAQYISCMGNMYSNATCTANQTKTGVPKPACR